LVVKSKALAVQYGPRFNPKALLEQKAAEGSLFI